MVGFQAVAGAAIPHHAQEGPWAKLTCWSPLRPSQDPTFSRDVSWRVCNEVGLLAILQVAWKGSQCGLERSTTRRGKVSLHLLPATRLTPSQQQEDRSSSTDGPRVRSEGEDAEPGNVVP